MPPLATERGRVTHNKIRMKPILFPLPFKTNNGHLIALQHLWPRSGQNTHDGLVDRRRQLDGRVESCTRERYARMKATHTYRWGAGVIFTDSRKLPGTLVSGCCKSGLSASEDTDHISEKRRIEAYRLTEGDRRGEKAGARIVGHVWSTHTVGDLILRHYTDGQAVISGDYLWIGNGYIDVEEDLCFVSSSFPLYTKMTF